MKLCIFLTLFSLNAFAVCDTVISRTNSSPNTVLTSTKYNLDLNTVYSRVNDLPGDCVTDGTIGASKLEEADFAPLLEGIKEGCFATRSDANTISIDKCIISVSGNLIKKTTATTVTWGCSGCSSETTSTTYYVYATDASTLTLKISTTAPDAFGYNGAERVLARFYNDAASAIDQYSLDNWVVNRFVPASNYLGALTFTGSWVSNATYTSECWREGDHLYAKVKVATSAGPTATTLTLTLPNSYLVDTGKLEIGADTLSVLLSNGQARDQGGNAFGLAVEYSGTSTAVTILVWGASTTYVNRATVTNTIPFTFGANDTVQVEFKVPIVGWNP